MISNNCVAQTYNRFPLTLVKGSGVEVWDDTGKRYLDFAAGIAVCSLGHCHPDITDAISEQSKQLVHVSNLYWTRPQVELASLLTEHCFADQAFFCNSGAEAVEAAIKLARRYGHDTKGPDCYNIVCLHGSFHGRTLATITATGQPVFQQGFEPLPAGFLHIPPNDLDALKLAFTSGVAALLVEPIQGEGGVRPLSDDFLLLARELCDRNGALLMFDEVQVGMGRTGSLFAYEQTPVVPDVLCLAKALGNGIPIGAMLARQDVMAHLTPGSHASTFGGNPVACAAAIAALKLIDRPEFLKGVRDKGEYLHNGLLKIAQAYPNRIKEVRGRGLIQAIEMKDACPALAQQMLEAGFLTILSHGKILRLVPPLIIEKRHIDQLLTALDKIIVSL